MKRLLFIGNFLSKVNGTINPSEHIISLLDKRYKISSASYNKGLFRRAIDILSYTSFRQYDILHIDIFSGSFFYIAWCSSIISWARGKKIILNFHGGKLPEIKGFKVKLLYGMMRRAVRVVSPSMFVISSFQKRHYSIEYLPNFVNLDSFTYDRSHVRPLSLLWVRAFGEMYNPQVAIRILHQVRKNYPEATLTMIGPDKGLLSACKKLIGDLELTEAVTISGPIKNENLPDYYKRHAVFLNTPSFESFGVAVMEAAASGIPIVSFSVGEIKMLWRHGENCLLAEFGDIEHLSESVQLLFKDTELTGKISSAARKKAEEFSWQQIEKKWINMFESV